ncbi:MAG: ribosome maturation factor RimP [Deltaproteobacteria bacterium]|nr:MAG: ribosome maturation factor RimP [Deltaproteobacteria bacterium]
MFLAGSADERMREKVWKITEPLAQQEGYELVDVEVVGAPGNYIVRVYIDREGGVTMGDCVSFSRLLGTVFDVEDPIPTRYTLEVSSPGVNRVLRKPEHFRRVTGQRVLIRLEAPVGGKRRVKGVLLDATDREVRVEEDGDEFIIEYENIKKANLVVYE